MNMEFKILRKSLIDKIPYVKDVSYNDGGSHRAYDFIDITLDKDVLINEYGLDDIFTFPMTTKHFDALLDDDYYLEEDIYDIIKKVNQTKHIPKQHKNRKLFKINNYIIS